MPKPKASRPYMPGYGIADAKGGRGLLPWRWAEECLQKGRTYFLSTADSTGKPHLMPVWGVWFNGAFFFSTGNKSRKARNLSANSRCSIATEIDFEKRPRKKGQINDTVILEGFAKVIADTGSRKKFCIIYQEKYGWDMADFDEPIYRLNPSVVFGIASEFTETATRWKFDHGQ